MKVQDLIDLLSKVNPEAKLQINSSSGLPFDIDTNQLMMGVFDEKVKETDVFKLRIV